MKKIIIVIALLIAIICPVFAAESYNHNYNEVQNRFVQSFIKAYYNLNTSIQEAYNKNGRYYSNFNDVWNLAIKTSVDYENISNGIAYPLGNIKMEVKYTKLKNVCTKVSSTYSPSEACAKLVVDVNGFSKGTNKLISDTSTLLPKDQFVLWLYSNGVKAEKGSIEETLLFLNNMK